MEFPDLPDAAVGALIAGALAFLTQALVKVWEVRQRRRDTVAPIYADRLAAVFRAVRLARRYQGQRVRTDLLRRIAEPSPFGTDPWKKDETAQRTANYSKAQDVLAARLTDLLAAYEALDSNRALFLLYARPPLNEANGNLQAALDGVLNDDDDEADDVDTAAAEWARVAQRELVAMGSIGFSVLIHGMRSYTAQRRLTKRRNQVVSTDGSPQNDDGDEASPAPVPDTTHDASDRQP